jgi:hypothetical protein
MNAGPESCGAGECEAWEREGRQVERLGEPPYFSANFKHCTCALFVVSCSLCLSSLTGLSQENWETRGSSLNGGRVHFLEGGH